MTAEKAKEMGHVGRFVHRVANIKLVTLLAVALIVMGLGLLAITAVAGIALVDTSNQTGQINQLRIQNIQLNGKLTNVGTRLNEQQQQINELLSTGGRK